MATDETLATATTTTAVAATSQSRDSSGLTQARASNSKLQGEGERFVLGDRLRQVPVEPYQRQPGDPLYRPLRIYTVDPSTPKLDGAVATINVPYEPLEPGPVGALFKVSSLNEDRGVQYGQADLDHPHVLMADGYQPSPSNPRFHQQMVYAVSSSVYSAFRAALGRNLSWGFGSTDVPTKLVLKPHAGEQRNAFYARDGVVGAIRFGYFPADDKPTDGSMPGGFVFTCLSQDIIAHEVTHALLDGLRAHFSVPSGSEVPAFHEAFADLVAIFQHFSYREVLITAIQRSRGELENAELLRSLARQFGHTTGRKGPLRSAVEENVNEPKQYDPDNLDIEAHALGSILVSAVFEAFVTIFKRKTMRYVRLATHGSGVLPPGEISHDLQNVLAQKASRLASQFLTICIRAIDYCPPAGINFGDYLRALITADFDVVPDDPWDYRGALVTAFQRRNIYPRDVSNLSEDALLWRAPRIALPSLTRLSFAKLRFRGDPARAADIGELCEQACAIGQYVTQVEYMQEFGLACNGDVRLEGDRVDLPVIESIRTARRVGPDGQVVFDQIAEITQLRHVKASGDRPGFSFHGGATVILGPEGNVRYVVLKCVANRKRVGRRREFLRSKAGSTYWTAHVSGYKEKGSMFKLAHEDDCSCSH